MFNAHALADNAVDALRNEKRRLNVANKGLQQYTIIRLTGKSGLYSVERVFELAKGLPRSVDCMEVDDRDYFAIGPVISVGIGEIAEIVE